MDNPRNNRTTAERQPFDGYEYAADLINEAGHAARYWFRDLSDRAAFARLWTDLQVGHGHQTTVRLIEELIP